MVESIAECSKQEHSAKLSTFIMLPFVIKIVALYIFEWPFYTGFTQVLLYIERLMPFCFMGCGCRKLLRHQETGVYMDEKPLLSNWSSGHSFTSVQKMAMRNIWNALKMDVTNVGVLTFIR